ncbi:MAG: GNAT family N-acetyltransferase [Waddliaceae bacterium]
MVAMINEAAPIPFNYTGEYTGKITTEFYLHEKTGSFFIRSIGERLIVQNFTEPYQDEFKQRFAPAVGDEAFNIPQLDDMCAVFGDSKTTQNYASGQTRRKEEVQKKIERDSTRPLNGNPFTGFMIFDKDQKRVIGRISSGSCYSPGHSQAGLIIHSEERGTRRGLEAVMLVAGIMNVLWENRYAVNGEPVKIFTAAVKNDNDPLIAMVTSLGMKRLRPLTGEENYSEDPRSLYGIEAKEVRRHLESRMTNPKDYTIAFTTI